MSKKLFITIVFFYLFVGSFCQSSFEFTINSPFRDGAIQTIEWDNYYYTYGYIQDSSSGASGIIIKYNDSNNIQTYLTNKVDTTTILYFGFINSIENLVSIGTSFDSLLSCKLYISISTPNLEFIEEKYYDIVPDNYDYISLYDMAIDKENHIVMVGHFEMYGGGAGNCFVIIKLDQDGNLLNYNYDESVYYDGDPRADLIAKQDGGGYYYFNGGSYDWVEYNNDLEYVNGGYYLDPPYSLGSTVSCKYLSNGNLIFVGTESNDPYFYDLRLMIFNPDFNLMKDTIIVEEGRQYAALYKGIDFIDDNNIWVAVHDSWMSPTGTEIYQVYLFDSDLHVKGNKYFGGDTQYDFYYVTATTDYGCVITGTLSPEQGSMTQDIFIKKVMPEDIITGDDEKVFTEFKDVLVYPNPVTDKIMLKTSHEGLSFTLYDFTGQKVLKTGIDTYNINEINVSKLLEGYYIYSITRPDGTAIDGGKLLKR